MLIALRTKGETVDELVGLATTMRRLATPVRDRPRRPDRHRRHRRRAPDVQRLDDGGADRRRRGLRGGQARQPLGHRAVGLGRPARGARRADRPRARRGRPLHRRGRLRLHVRARPPRRHALRGPGAQGARRAHDLQLPRPAHQPRGGDAPGDRRVRRGVPGHIAGALAKLGARKALVVSSADGLDEMSTSGTTRVVEVDGPELTLLRGRPRRTSGSPRAPPGGRWPAARRTSTPPPRGGSSRASAARSATWPCSTPARRSTSPAARTRSRRACGPPRRRSTTGARRESARAAGGDDAGAGAGVSVLERIVEDTRDEVGRRRESVPLARLEAAAAERPEERPFEEALLRPGHLADRRAQAPLAVGGQHPRGLDGRGHRARLRARRGRRAVDPHRAVPLRRLARRPARARGP